MNKEQFEHYKIGIPEIDDEHWTLFQLLDALSKAIDAGDVELSKTKLDTFFEALNTHSAHEEEIMKECGFPYVVYHASSHPESTMQLIARKDIDAAHILHTDVKSMVNLLSTHIDHADRQITQFYNKVKSDTK